MAHYIFIVEASFTDSGSSFHWVRTMGIIGPAGEMGSFYWVRTMGSFRTERDAWRAIDRSWDRWQQLAWMAGDRTDYIDVLVRVVRSIAFR
jgi:hypothetical protein